MAEGKDTNVFIAKGKVFEIGPASASFELHVRPDRNGMPRRRRRDGENAQPASAGTEAAAEAGGGSQPARAATFGGTRGRRRREDPDGLVMTITMGRQTDAPMALRWGDEVEVRGHVEAFSGYSYTWGSYSYIQNLVADEVRFSKTRINDVFGVDAGFYTGPDRFEACFSGIVTDRRESKNEKGEATWINLTLKVSDGTGMASRRPSEIRLQYSAKARVNDAGVEKGDVISVIARVMTRRKTSNGEDRRFVNFLVEDVHVIKKAAASKDAEREAEEMFAALDDDFEGVEDSHAEAPPIDEAEEGRKS